MSSTRTPTPTQGPRRVNDLFLGAVWQLGLLLIYIAIATIAIVLMTRGVSPVPGRPVAASFPAMSILAGAAALSTGLIVGFLFGVPRARIFVTSQEVPRPNALPGSDSTEVQTAVLAETSSLNPSSNVPNTNLEQISDWLTKIIVGVSIAQASEIANTAGRLFNTLARDVGQPASSSFFGLLMTSAASLGFIYGWLTARVWIARLLTASDRTEPAAGPASAAMATTALRAEEPEGDSPPPPKED